MNLQAIYHRVDGVFGYQNKNGSFTVRLRGAIDDINSVSIIYGDRYNWSPVKGSDVWEWNYQDEVEMDSKGNDHLYEYFEYILDDKSNEHRYKYAFVIKFKNGKKYLYGENVFNEIKDEINIIDIQDLGFVWGMSNNGKFVSSPDWFKKTNWYQIFPDRFHKLDGIKHSDDLTKKTNGDIKGIISSLDYIKNLGFNGIYLNPIFESNSPHMYDTIDYMKIAHTLGTLEDFQLLIKELKKRDMKIMLDGVFNHSGSDFFAWKDVLKNKENSKYKDWFFINDFNNLKEPELYKNDEFTDPTKKPYSTFGNTPFMPRLNWENKGVLDYLEKAVKYWTSMGIHAWRLDVADEPSFEFWRKFKTWVNDSGKDIAILGEIWYDSLLFLMGDQFDSTMNYPFRTNALDYFVSEKIDFKQFKERFINSKFKYSKYVNDSQFNLLTSHDTARLAFYSKNNLEKLKVAYSWLFLNPGSTSFYYGDEYLQSFDSVVPEDGRIIFDVNKTKDSPLYKHIKSIMKFRNDNIDLIMSGINNIENDNDKITIEYNNGNVKLDLLTGNIYKII